MDTYSACIIFPDGSLTHNHRSTTVDKANVKNLLTIHKEVSIFINRRINLGKRESPQEA